MATPIAFKGANLQLIPPPGEEANCVPLDVLRRDGQIISCWMPSAAELAEILKTGRIWLSVWGGRTSPPVYVTGHQAEVI